MGVLCVCVWVCGTLFPPLPGVESGSNRSPVSSPSRNKKLKSKVKSQPTLEGSPVGGGMS